MILFVAFKRVISFFKHSCLLLDSFSNKIYLEEDKLHIGEKVFDFANIEDQKDQAISALESAYYNVNSKTLKEKFTEKFIEFYLEGGKLKKREWANYQTYLASSKYPDGSKRKATPIYTNISQPSDSQPNNFKQKYAILSSLGEEFPQVTKKPKEEPAVKGKYVWDGKTKNITTITLFKGTPQQKEVNISFTGVLEKGAPSITLIEDAETIQSLNEAAENKPTVTAAKQVIEKLSGFIKSLTLFKVNVPLNPTTISDLLAILCAI